VYHFRFFAAPRRARDPAEFRFSGQAFALRLAAGVEGGLVSAPHHCFCACLAMRTLLNFDMGVVILAIACRFLLPSHTLLTFQFGGIAKGIGINRVAFWSVLVVGAVMFVVRFVRR
jgi:hypothetical protein